MLYKVLDNLNKGRKLSRRGNLNFTRDIDKALHPNTKYCLFVIGFDKGRTTQYKRFNFTTLAQ